MAAVLPAAYPTRRPPCPDAASPVEVGVVVGGILLSGARREHDLLERVGGMVALQLQRLVSSFTQDLGALKGRVDLQLNEVNARSAPGQ